MMFDAAKYGNDAERILDAVESGRFTAEEVLGHSVCFTCKTVRHTDDLNICTVCGEGHCDTCPPFCDCRVTENLVTLGVVGL